MTAMGLIISAPRAKARGALTPDFEALVGETAWGRLPLAVRSRFGAEAHHRPRAYPGVMQVRASRFGRLIAQICRLIGTPIAPWTGPSVPVSVLVWPAADGGMVWDRTYAFDGRPDITVTSAKVMSRNGQLLEIVRGGLGMRLAVGVEDGALVFRSRGYFWRIGALRLPIPSLLTPGRALIVHRDNGGGLFTFSMRFVHSIAGETLSQEGQFKDPSTRLLDPGLSAPAAPATAAPLAKLEHAA